MSGRGMIGRDSMRSRTALLAVLLSVALAPPAYCAGTAKAAAATRATAQAIAAPAKAAPAIAQRRSIVEGADGVPLNVIEVGDPAKPAIVLIHGFGQSHHSFNAQLNSAQLASQFHIVAFDLRGHGFSGKPWAREAYTSSDKWAEDLQRVMTATKVQKPVILGWSYGSLVVADYLRKYGTRELAGIVLAGAYGGLTDPPPPPAQPPSAAALAEMAHVRDQQLSGDMAERVQGVAAFARRLTARKMPDAWMDDAIMLGMLTATEARRYMFERSLVNKDLVASIDVPFLVVIGGKDGSTPEGQGRALAAAVPQGRASFYPQSGHSAFAEFPERFNSELASFAAQAHAQVQGSH